ncbi:MAG: hypothetical protein RL708_496 [Bacteroidota bacterium]|jgi:hypothetical protein
MNKITTATSTQHTAHSTQHTAHSTLNIKPSKLVIIMLLMAFSVFKTNSAKAQTSADSALTVTDTSITTPNNIVVTDSSGSTTLFAGGQQSDFEGKVGVGTNQPTSKLSVYDDKNASFRLSQPVSNTNSQMRSISTSNGEVIRNFEIDILNEGTSDGFFDQGSVILSTFSGEPQGQISGSSFDASAAMRDVVSMGPMEPDPCLEPILSGSQPPISLPITAKSFGWYGIGCPVGSPTLNMYLDPYGNLSVKGGGGFGGTVTFGSKKLWTSNNWYKGIKMQPTTAIEFTTPITRYGIGASASTDLFYLFSTPSENTADPAKYILASDADGNIGLSTNPNTGFKLSVNGEIRAKGVTVETGWSDFVFDKDYKLMSITQLENYINQNHHLPQIPSAAQVAEHGIELGSMESKLLQKIEELTLYMVQQQKEIEELKKQVTTK